MVENELFICQCNSLDHIAIFSYFPEDKEVIMSVHLCPESNIFKRIVNAFKYIISKYRYGCFEEFIFKKEDAGKLAKILKNLDPDVQI